MKPRSIAIRFMGEITLASISSLLQTIDREIEQGAQRVRLLISSPGGQVSPAITAYNMLRGLRVPVETLNLGTVESMAVPLYCAGEKRLAMPQSRFVIHRLAWRASGVFTEDRVREHLRGLEVDHGNVQRILSERTGMPLAKAVKLLAESAVLSADEALKAGLVHEIATDVMDEGTKLIAIPSEKA
jgi:ATP-dependent Clp protease, protease subunit